MNIGPLIHSWNKKPFEYGKTDCCQFAGAIIEVQTGVNPMKSLQYHDKKSALAVIKRYGSLLDAICEFMGGPMDAEDCEHGDLVLLDVGGEQIAGIRYLDWAVSRKKGRGNIGLPLASVTDAWEPSWVL